MKYSSGFTCLAAVASAISLSSCDAVATAEFRARALPDAPNGYTPAAVECPSTRPSVRGAGTLSQQEQNFLSVRKNVTIPALQGFLQRMNISDFDVNSYFSSHLSNTSNLPNVAIALSGGGYRALLNGAGHIQAFDNRESNSTNAGQLGGLLQSSTYLAGLSGGSWLVGSIFVNNFTTISALLGSQGSQWEFQNSIFEGPDRGLQVLTSVDYYDTIYNEVQGKTANYNTTVTDYWGRALSFQLINDTNGGPSYTWSSIANQDGFAAGQQPFPILIADERQPNQQIISANSSIYEFNPFEFGTWDPTVFGFVPLKYIGANFSNGVLAENETCVRGFDNAGYVMGTSSSLFNQFLLEINSTSAPQVLVDAVQSVLKTVAKGDDDIAAYEPNPFYGYDVTGKSDIANITQLTLVDGGSDLQNIPLQPLIQPLRSVDVIFAIDSSADTDMNWPNGTSLVATYERSTNSKGIANGTSFPAVPDVNTFVNLGLNTRPTFFGCNASNTSTPTPLIVYLPNTPYVYLSNVSTFNPSYNTSERNAIVENGYWAATLANGTADPQWPTCVGCAILSRSLDRTGTTVPPACSSCLSRYCWDGTVNSTVPNDYTPSVRNASVLSAAPQLASGNLKLGSHVAAAVAVMAFVMIM